MNGKLGDNVSQQEVAAVLAGWIHTGFGEKARPSKGHETPQLAVPALVVVMDVVRCVLYQQGRELKQVDPQ